MKLPCNRSGTIDISFPILLRASLAWPSISPKTVLNWALLACIEAAASIASFPTSTSFSEISPNFSLNCWSSSALAALAISPKLSCALSATDLVPFISSLRWLKAVLALFSSASILLASAEFSPYSFLVISNCFSRFSIWRATISDCSPIFFSANASLSASLALVPIWLSCSLNELTTFSDSLASSFCSFCNSFS